MKEFEQIEVFLKDMLETRKKPPKEYTSEEFVEIAGISASKVTVDIIMISIRNIIKNLKGANEYNRCLAILSSGAVQVEIDRCLQEFKDRNVNADTQKLELINDQVKEEMKGVPNYVL